MANEFTKIIPKHLRWAAAWAPEKGVSEEAALAAERRQAPF